MFTGTAHLLWTQHLNHSHKKRKDYVFMTMFELMDGLWLGDSSFQYETILNDSGNIHIFRVRLCGISTKDVQLTGIQFTG